MALTIVKSGAGKVLNICKDCKYYVPKYISKCSKFSIVDVRSGNTVFSTAEFARENENMCGRDGKEFEKKRNWYLWYLE